MIIKNIVVQSLSAMTLFGLVSHTAIASQPDNTILAHDVYGTGSEKVLVLHSWMGDAKSFNAVKPYLDTETFTYVFADIRGYGQSRNLSGQYTVDEVSADAFKLADHLNWTQFHLVGHSMSGMVAQRMMINDWKQKTHQIKSIVAITPVGADGFKTDEQTKQFLWNLIHQHDMTAQGIAALTGQRLLPKWNQQAASHNLDTSTADAMRGYYKMWVETDFSAEAAATKPATPIRIIGGRQDLPGFSESQLRKTFITWYPGADLQFITDAGHFPMYETPVYLATLIESFLNTHRNEESKPIAQSPR